MNLVALGRAVPGRPAARQEWRGRGPVEAGLVSCGRLMALMDASGATVEQMPHHDGRAQRGAMGLINADQAEGRIPTPSRSLVGSNRQTAEITAMKEACADARHVIR